MQNVAFEREDFAFEFCGQFFFGGEKKYSTAKPRRFEMEDFLTTDYTDGTIF
jgi:hypothetical protein